jgi:hypothetical protein
MIQQNAMRTVSRFRNEGNYGRAAVIVTSMGLVS